MIGIGIGSCFSATGSYTASGEGVWTPALLSPEIWYNSRSESGLEYYNSFENSNTAPAVKVKSIVNLANPSTYKTTSSTQTLSPDITCDGISSGWSYRGRNGSYARTGYYPSARDYTIITKIKVAPVNLTRCYFGVNDGTSKSFFLETVQTTGTLRLGIGATYLETTQTYPEGSILDVVIIRSGTNNKMWVNGTLVIDATSAWTGTSSKEMVLFGRTTSTDTITNIANLGELGELIIVHRAISEDERLKAITYLSNWTPTRKYHVFAIKGQSNASGVVWYQADYSTTEKPNYRIHQINRASSYDGDIVLAYEPLKHVAAEPEGVTFGYAFAKAYLARQTDPNIHVLFVPCALGDTGYSNNRWRVGDDLHEALITRTNAAMAKGYDMSFKGILEFMGERDCANSVSQVDFTNYTSAAIADFRSRITGASNCPYIISTLVPEFSGAPLLPVELAINNMPSNVTRCAVVNNSDLTGYTGDSTHFNGLAQRIIGGRFDAAYQTL